MNAQPQRPPLAGPDLDRALTTANDSILPSSGFVESVMATVVEQAAMPAPIPFPWKRALPGLIGVAAALVLLVATLPAVLRSASSSIVRPAVLFGWRATQPLTGHSAEALGLGVSLAISLACLMLCRRLVSAR